MWTRLFVGSAILSISVLAHAQGTQLWQQSSYESFETGTPHGVAIRSDGQLESSPVASEILTTAASEVWSVTVDKRGNAYLGTGSPAIVLKVTPDGKSTPLLETKDVSVQVVKIGPDGMLYAATLPNGKVYRINPDGPEVKIDNAPHPVYKQGEPTPEKTGDSADIVFDSSTLSPKVTYIWDLTFDAEGRMYVATGGPADIYRVDLKKPGSASEKFFSSSEQHIRCLMFAKDGTLYAGTDGRGLVYRIDTSGKGFVLFEAPNQEIPAMTLDPAGNLYVAALGEKGKSTLPPLNVHSSASMTASITILLPGSIASSHDSTLVPKGTAIYQISPEGAPRQLWASQHDVVYALAWQQNADPKQSGLLAGSGNQGHLYRIYLDGTFADLAHLEATDATAFAMADINLYVATSNTGKLYRLLQNSAGSGDNSTYISPVADAKFSAAWGLPAVRGNGHYDMFARVGNIEQPTEGWSDWQPISQNGETPKFHRARFLQWKAVFHGDATLRQVGFYYLPQNVAPVVDDIVLELYARVVPGLNQESQVTPVQINFPADSADGVVYETQQNSQPLMAMRTRGWATVRWKAHDDNGDHLQYSVYYRGADEANWLLLEQNVPQTYLSFDLNRIPDGYYALRIVATDAPSHLPGNAMTGYKDSDQFLIDTMPPVLSLVQATLTSQPATAIHVTFAAQDKLSTIARAYYSVDAGPWQYIDPIGNLSDSLHERYDFTIPIPKSTEGNDDAPAVQPRSPQQHVVAVRVLNRAGNSTTGKAVVQ
jgi:outer membrane protein assembly factor BamB